MFGSLYLFGDSPTSCSDPLSFSVALRHRAWIHYLFDDSSTSCSDPLSYRWISEIVFGSSFFSTVLRHHVRILIFSTALRHRARIPYIFSGSPASCPDPLSFRQLSNIVFGSLIFSAALRHPVRIPYLFDGF